MNSNSPQKSAPFGQRLLPQTLDDLAEKDPQRLYASIAISNQVQDGFLDITFRDMALCVDFMADWLREKIGLSQSRDPISYIGISDLRAVPIFFAAIKCGYKLFLPSPRNTIPISSELLKNAECKLLLYAREMAFQAQKLTEQSQGAGFAMKSFEIPSFQDMLSSQSQHFPFRGSFDERKHEPILMLHTSGSTGTPKLIDLSHMTFATLDDQRNLPEIPGRKKADYPTAWDLQGGGKFYTVFPAFHIAGWLTLVYNPIFTDSSPVLGPPLAPPSGLILKEVMSHQSLSAIYCPGSVIEEMLKQPENLELLKSLDFVAFGGAPLSPQTSKKILAISRLCCFFGITETGPLPVLDPEDPEDWSYMEFHPDYPLRMEPYEGEPGIFELVIDSKPGIAIYYNLPGLSVYRTKDLFARHSDPRKKALYRYYGRSDDMITLSNGLKFNPTALEMNVTTHALLSGAMVIGEGRSQTALLLESKSDMPDSNHETKSLVDLVWPTVETANSLIPAHGRIEKSHILFTTPETSGQPEKRFARAAKGTVMRKMTEKRFLDEINRLYEEAAPDVQKVKPLDSTQPLDHEEILRYIRDVAVELCPDLRNASNLDTLFAFGLDSVRSIAVVAAIKQELKKHTGADTRWFTVRVVYEQQNLMALANVLHKFLMTGSAPPKHDNRKQRENAVDAAVREFSSSVTPSSVPRAQRRSRCVTVVGSTGYLGPYILRFLLTIPEVSKIICLNRSDQGESRTMSKLQPLMDPETSRSIPIVYYKMQLDAPNLGLDDEFYNTLKNETTTIVYNSWQLDFGAPALLFKPFLRGLQTLVDLCLTSPLKPRIVFLSSIGATGNWARVHPSKRIAPESLTDDAFVSFDMHYATSKLAAEKILLLAHREKGLAVSVARVGQIAGPTSKFKDAWNMQQWISSIIITSKTIGAAPVGFFPIDWIPVDVVGQTIAKLCMETINQASDLRVVNVVNPQSLPWDTFLSAADLGSENAITHLPVQSWLDKVEDTFDAGKFQAEQLPALRLMDFFRSVGDGRENDFKFATGNLEALFEDPVEPTSEDVLRKWLADWRL